MVLSAGLSRKDNSARKRNDSAALLCVCGGIKVRMMSTVQHLS